VLFRILRSSGVASIVLLMAARAAAQEPTPVSAAPPPMAAEPTPPPHKGPSPLMQSLYGLTILVQALDIHSTFRALDAGGKEANPIVMPFADRRGLYVAFRSGIAAAAIYNTHNLARRHKIAAVAVNIGVNCAYGAIVAHNYHVARQMRARQP